MTQPLVTFEDVTTIMRLIGELRDDVCKLREFIVEDDGEEEEEPEADG